MSKAARSPTLNRKRSYLVADHVVEQMRKRYTRDSISHRDGTDLKNLVDVAVVEAVKNGDCKYITDEDEESQIVCLSKALSDDLWALVKKNTDPRYPMFEEAVVTLLKNEQVERSMASGKFSERTGGNFAMSPENVDRLKSITPSSPKEAVEKPSTSSDVWFVHYSTKSGNSQIPEEYVDLEKALDRMDDLSSQQKTVPGTVRLSKSINTRRRFTIQD